jgi:CheY-like chemotaxis protein
MMTGDGTRPASEVLVVDDDEAVLQTIAEALEMEGYLVVTALNGALALERIRQRRPDVVLLDLLMPVLDGWTFLPLCRAEPGCADVPVVVLTVLDPRLIGTVQAEAFLGKPFELGELLATVERMVAAGH